MTIYAHSCRQSDGTPCPVSEWELLYTETGEGHLEKVSKLAAFFASKFGAAEWGELAGLWHDLGKYSEAFQAYLLRENGFEAHLEQYKGRVDHSTAGAKHAVANEKLWGRLLAYVIAGHHAGLADAFGDKSSLDGRLKKVIESVDSAPQEVLEAKLDLPIPVISATGVSGARNSFQLAFFTRMLFSCLVDADFLATEAFMSPEKAKDRPAKPASFVQLQSTLDEKLISLAQKSTGSSVVNACRREVLQACRSSAKLEPGLFSLAVPTGGGKTLASLAFALDHAIEHDLNRIIYAIPFTSIIEQTADVFRGVFEELPGEIVLEQHSNLDPDSKHETPQSRLASQNWDAPLVVTTNVQLFESLFASRTSRCRKLHNLVGSVIILDEAQTLPVELLQPVLAAIRELVTDYHCTIVLCTATQPALEHHDDFPIGLTGIREIVADPPELYRRMRRVEVRTIGEQTDEQLVERFAETPSFLAILNTRPHAARLFELLKRKKQSEDSLFHLSTFLCGEHRSARLKEICRRLDRKLPCCVISTQLVEAGVDVDFPVVFRALTGLDSLAQAAGRCNREGKLPQGIVNLFDPVECQPQGYLGSVAATAKELIPDFDDLLDPAAIEQYFQLHYWKQAGDHRWDDRQVMACFPTPPQEFAFDFSTASERFRMIEDTTTPVLVPYGEKGQRLIEQLREDGPDRDLMRRLQRFSVGVYDHVYSQLVGSDVEELPNGGFAVLINEDLYDEQLGLMVDRPGFHQPENMIV